MSMHLLCTYEHKNQASQILHMYIHGVSERTVFQKK